MQKIELTSEQIALLAEKYLRPHQPSNYQIRVLRNGIRQDHDGWWEVPVKPSKSSAPSYDWIGRCAEAAVDMDEAENVHVLFV